MILLLHRVLLNSRSTVGVVWNHNLLGKSLYRFCFLHCWLAWQTLEVLTCNGMFFQQLFLLWVAVKDCFQCRSNTCWVSLGWYSQFGLFLLGIALLLLNQSFWKNQLVRFYFLMIKRPLNYTPELSVLLLIDKWNTEKLIRVICDW